MPNGISMRKPAIHLSSPLCRPASVCTTARTALR